MLSSKFTITIISIFAVVAFLMVSCRSNDDKSFGIFKVLKDSTTVVMNGEIGSSSLSDFNKLVAAHPNIKTVNIKNCGGSMDDEVNLKLSARVHELGLNTHLMDNGLIASGGVDFFLAGKQRTKGKNTKIGVHSWSDGNGTSATDFPVGHEYHLPYIKYYVSVGFTQEQAEAFYYFTINAAAAEDIHYMTDAEIAQYNIVTG